MQNYINFKFGFTDPKDPDKAHILQGLRKEINTVKDYIELERILVDKLINNEFSCRDDILKALKDADIEVTRVGKEYINIKLPNSKKAKRFKGEGICLMKALQTLQAWSNSEKRYKEEQKSLKIKEMDQIIYTQNNQIKNLKEDRISLQINLEQITKENLELSNSNKACQQEIESLADSKQNLTMKYKKETTTLKSKLQESRKEAQVYQILSAIIFIVIAFLSIWSYSLYSENKKLKQTNKNIKTYIQQNISDNK